MAKHKRSFFVWRKHSNGLDWMVKISKETHAELYWKIEESCRLAYECGRRHEHLDIEESANERVPNLQVMGNNTNSR